MGAGGFVGQASSRLLERTGVEVIALTRKEVDLLAVDAAGRLASSLSPESTLIVTSAQAPCKNVPMLLANLRMMEAVITAVKSCPVRHLVYISSDAVYKDSSQLLSEISCAEPASLHGVMHWTREVMLKNELPNVPQVVVRPTLIFGPGDPHNGYGPNRFMRLANQGEEIVLFGEGEELRDHIFIEDVADIVRRCVVHRDIGVVNAVTGIVTSFKAIAEMAAMRFEPRVLVRASPRRGPMPHGGYRAFDCSLLKQVFPDFKPTPLADGLESMS
jgi:nucleoside-diphosphate-sugar epimerase